MLDDIVTRLRTPLPYNLVGLTTKDLGDERYEAADEIERLRAERDRWRKLAQGEHYAWSQCSYGCNCMMKIYEQAVRGES